MQRRFWYGLGILAVLLALGLGTSWSMKSMQRPVTDALEQAAQAVMEGNLEKGKALALQAQDAWQEHREKATAVADHGPLEEIDSLFAQIQIYGQAGKSADFAAYCTRLAKLVAAVEEAHSLNWQNLL